MVKALMQRSWRQLCHCVQPRLTLRADSNAVVIVEIQQRAQVVNVIQKHSEEKTYCNIFSIR